MVGALHNAAEAAVQALRQLRDAALEEAGAGPVGAAVSTFSLIWRDDMEPDVLASLAAEQAAEAAAEEHVFRNGNVYCYACGSASCEHAHPPQPDMVFAAYQSTGRPEWMEFFNVLLELGDPRTDQLFAGRSEVLTRVLGRRRLTSEQLVSFGRNSLTYRIWGQVVAGLFAVGGQRAAMTIQLVEDKSHRLHLQEVASPALREALADAPADRRSSFSRVYDALAEARRQIESLSHLWQPTHARKDLDKIRDKAFSILRHLGNSIERKGRQGHRRTAHAEIRGAQQRPVHKARDDVAGATSADIMHDVYKNSIIVLGKAGRLHAFSLDGRHITSLFIKGDELERRCKRKRYTPMIDKEVAQFRASVLAVLPPDSARRSRAEQEPLESGAG